MVSARVQPCTTYTVKDRERLLSRGVFVLTVFAHDIYLRTCLIASKSISAPARQHDPQVMRLKCITGLNAVDVEKEI